MSALERLFGRGTVTYHIAVAEALDSVAAAIFAEQIAFWQARSDDGWAFRSSDQIKEYTALTRRVQDTARKKLKDAGVMEEKIDGAPPRLYFRLDLDKLSQLIGHCNPNAQNRQPDAQNALPVCTKPPTHIEEGESKDISPTEGTDKAVGVKPVPIEKWYVTQFYDQLQDEYQIKLRPDQFGFQVKQMERMLKQSTPTDEEMERVVSHMVKKYPSSPKVDALSAIQDVRLGRDNGEAWSGPAPWEKAKQEREPINPHSDKGEELRSKPYKAHWYVAAYDLTFEEVDAMLEEATTHGQMLDEIGGRKGWPT